MRGTVLENDASSVFYLYQSSFLCIFFFFSYRKVHTAGPRLVGEELREGSAAGDLHQREALPRLDHDGDGGSLRTWEKVEGRRDSNRERRKH